jgi:cellulose synthase (UDP-forming)
MHLPRLRDEEKARYATDSALSIKTKHIISTLTWILVMYGFYLSYRHNTLYLAIFGTFVLFVLIYLSISNIIGFQYKAFPYSLHRKRVSEYAEGNTWPSVDVFLPICGEPIEVLRNTWDGVREMRVSYPGSMNVYVLDDKALPLCQSTAEQYGFTYLTRPNRGEMKKAGNLKYGYEHSNGDFILILDADFRPHPDMVKEMLPYMDSTVGIVQSPQYFDTDGLEGLEYGAGNIQRHFYSVVQRARGSVGGSICVGSCGLYRRSALDQVGGTYQIEHSEDVWTGYSLRAKGWEIQYIPVPLSKGLCPDDLHNFFKQQNRWNAGSMSLLTSRFFWTAPVPWCTKMSYISGFMFYISNPLLLLFPIQNFVMIYDTTPVEWYIGLIFVPSVMFTTMFMWKHVYRDVKYGTVLAYMTSLWSYSYAMVANLCGARETWVATGGKQGLSKGFKRLVLVSTTYYVVYAFTVVYSLISGALNPADWHYGLSVFWIIVNFCFHGVYMHGMWSYLWSKRTAPAVKVADMPVPQMIQS